MSASGAEGGKTLQGDGAVAERLFERLEALLQCPCCQGALEVRGAELGCGGCQGRFPVQEGIPRLYTPNDWRPGTADVTERMRAFYEETPFPDYDDMDDVGSLVHKASRSLLPQLLFDQLPFGARVLECGCGTGQMTNYLSLGSRTAVGVDLCVNSLMLAAGFRDAHAPLLDGASFLQMNLFRPCFRPGRFDLVICNGVLHHTSDPRLGFETLARLVRPGGFILLGLYHRYARLLTDLRRLIFRVTGDRFRGLDPLNVKDGSGAARKRAWFLDQYKNPHESKHTIRETMEWLEPAGLTWVKSLPKTAILEPIDPREALFEPEVPAGLVETTLKEWSMALTHSREGGEFIIVARRPPE